MQWRYRFASSHRLQCIYLRSVELCSGDVDLPQATASSVFTCGVLSYAVEI